MPRFSVPYLLFLFAVGYSTFGPREFKLNYCTYENSHSVGYCAYENFKLMYPFCVETITTTNRSFAADPIGGTTPIGGGQPDAAPHSEIGYADEFFGPKPVARNEPADLSPRIA